MEKPKAGMAMELATARPWELITGFSGSWSIISSEGRVICKRPPSPNYIAESEAAGQLIVTSVNQHSALMEALRKFVKIAEEAAEEWDKAPEGMRAGKILLALAGIRKGYRADIDEIHALLDLHPEPAGGK